VIEGLAVQFEVNPSASTEPPVDSTEPVVTGSISLSWVAPDARTDETALTMSEIAGYTVYYGTSMGNYTDSFSINDGYASDVTLTGLPAATYYLVMTTRDTDGRESDYSSVVTKQAQ
jgi:hypothetical protein